MDEVRRPPVIAAVVLILVAFGIELGARFFDDAPRPGLGIPSLAAVDGLLLVSFLIAGSGTIGVSPHVVARTSGLVVTIAAIITLLASLILVFVTLGLLMLMVGLLLATPFGTIAYLAVWGHFDRGQASITLALLMLLKIAAAICAIIGAQQILKSKNLVLMFATSIGLTFLLTFLHGLPPRFLVSITDAIGAIIIFIFAIIWGIAYLIGGISGLLGAFQRHGRDPHDRTVLVT